MNDSCPYICTEVIIFIRETIKRTLTEPSLNLTPTSTLRKWNLTRKMLVGDTRHHWMERLGDKHKKEMD